jgi:uncharacterized membrane protein
MNDVIDVNAKDSEKAQELKTVGWISYVLHLIVALGAVIPGGQFGALLLVVALVIDLVKKDEAQGTWQASHFSWRIRSTIWMGILYVVTFPIGIFFLFLWNPAYVVISIWFLYRIVRGMVAMNNSQAVGV